MDPTQYTILVVDDEEDVVDLVCYNLEKEGFQTLRALNGTKGLEIAKRERPSVMILDLMLPGMNGLQVFHGLKQDSRTKDIPVIMLTAKAETSDRILGLKAGVDDYVTKPFSPKELILRVAAVLKWVRPVASETMVETGPFVLDRGQLRCYIGGELIHLTSTEFKILLALVDGSGVTVTRESLFEKIWGSMEKESSRTVDTHVTRLRRKLGEDGDRIKNVRGQGYRYEPEPDAA
ncbi:MAG: two-component system phosphate regulon response regulator PhoB [Verrucomicrobiales bacterium]